MDTDDLIRMLARQPDAAIRRPPAALAGLAIVVGLAGAFGLVLALLGARADLFDALGRPAFWQKVASLSVFAALSALVVYRAGLPGRAPGPAARLRWIVPAWLLAGTAAVWGTAPAGEGLGQFRSATIGLCLTMIPLLALPTALGFLAYLRQAAPTEPGRAATAVGLAAGGSGALAYAFHCPQDAPGYLLLWYSLAIVITVVLARAILPRFLRW